MGIKGNLLITFVTKMIMYYPHPYCHRNITNMRSYKRMAFCERAILVKDFLSLFLLCLLCATCSYDKSSVFKATVQFFLWKPVLISETMAIQNNTSMTLLITIPVATFYRTFLNLQRKLLGRPHISFIVWYLFIIWLRNVRLSFYCSYH